MATWWFFTLILVAALALQYAAQDRRLRFLERKVAFLLSRAGADAAAIEAALQKADEAAHQQLLARERRTIFVGGLTAVLGALVGAVVFWLQSVDGELAAIGTLTGGAAGFLIGCAAHHLVGGQ
jgi:hypothetical protein